MPPIIHSLRCEISWKNNVIRNFEAIATSEGRRLGLELVKAGLDAIETERVLRDVVALEGNELRVRERGV